MPSALVLPSSSSGMSFGRDPAPRRAACLEAGAGRPEGADPPLRRGLSDSHRISLHQAPEEEEQAREEELRILLDQAEADEEQEDGAKLEGPAAVLEGRDRACDTARGARLGLRAGATAAGGGVAAHRATGRAQGPSRASPCGRERTCGPALTAWEHTPSPHAGRRMGSLDPGRSRRRRWACRSPRP